MPPDSIRNFAPAHAHSVLRTHPTQHRLAPLVALHPDHPLVNLSKPKLPLPVIHKIVIELQLQVLVTRNLHKPLRHCLPPEIAVPAQEQILRIPARRNRLLTPPHYLILERIQMIQLLLFYRLISTPKFTKTKVFFNKKSFSKLSNFRSFSGIIS